MYPPFKNALTSLGFTPATKHAYAIAWGSKMTDLFVPQKKLNPNKNCKGMEVQLQRPGLFQPAVITPLVVIQLVLTPTVMAGDGAAAHQRVVES